MPIAAMRAASSPRAGAGLKSAIRGDSSFFAHGYRGTLIVITAALLGVDQRGWCLLVLGACLVLIAELAHGAVDTLARAIGDPEEPRLKTAREIAAAGVLVAAFGSGAVTLDRALVEIRRAVRRRFLTENPLDRVARYRPLPGAAGLIARRLGLRLMQCRVVGFAGPGACRGRGVRSARCGSDT